MSHVMIGGSRGWRRASVMKARPVAASVLSLALLLMGAGTASASAVAFEVWAEPGAGFGQVYRFILSARHSLDMTMYELGDRRAEADLVADASRGVNVRVLLDEAYHGGSYNEAAYSYLHSRGVHVEWAPSSVIVHQKTITVDDRAALIMTGNLTSEYYATSADFTLEDTKPADVARIVGAFDDDWAGDLSKSWYDVPAHGQEGDLIFSPRSEGALVGLISSAKHTVETSSEEMDSYKVEDALLADARRGVNVEVLMTEDSSWDSAFNELKAGGAHIKLYPYSYNGLYIHAKVIIVDGTTAYVGSINYSTASLVYNRELGLITSNPAVVKPVARAWSRWWAGVPTTY